MATALPVALTAGTVTAAAADDCQAPVVRDVMVSQGLPSYAGGSTSPSSNRSPYSELVRGKTALVKLFLSKPNGTSCTNVSSETFQVTGGSLTANNGSGTRNVPLDVPPQGSLPAFGEYGVSPITATPADPRFVVPGNVLVTADPTKATTSFDVSFTASLDYVVRSTSGAVVRTGNLAVSRRPSGELITHKVGKPTKPLRLLVVPMGNTKVTSPEQFPQPVASAEVDKGMAALSRLMPIPDGIGAPGSGAGLQWHLSAGMVNLGPHTELDPSTFLPKTVDYMSNGKFCGSSGQQYKYISQQLLQARMAWNAENPSAPVDRVLGVIWQGISRGPGTADGVCADGVAGVPGTDAWSRILTERQATDADGKPVDSPTNRQGVTGALAGLELLHTFGGSITDSTYHSPRSLADGTAPDRAYNVTTRGFLDRSRNRNVSKYQDAPYDDYTTLYEKTDWDFLGCVFASTSTSAGKDCGSTAATTGGVSMAGGSYVLGGHTDGTPAGTDAHTYFDDDMPRDGDDSGSELRLVQRNASGAQMGSSTGVRSHRKVSDHDADGEEHHTAGVSTFEVALEQQTGAVAFELWHGEPGGAGSVKLYERGFDGQAPVISDTSLTASGLTLEQYTNDGASRQPAVSPDGDGVAWTTASGVIVAPAEDSAQRSNAVAGEQAAWAPDGSRLAIVRNGEIFTVPVTRSATGFQLGAATKVYGTGLLGSAAAASRPTFSPDGASLAVAVVGDIYALDLGLPVEAYPLLCPLSTSGLPALPGCRRLTSTPDVESHPAWSAETSVLAYERTPAGGRSAVWTLDPAASTASSAVRVSDATFAVGQPSWSGSRLLVRRGDGVASVDGATFDDLKIVTSGPADGWPSSSRSGALVVLQRGSASTDLFSLSFARFTSNVTVTDDNPGLLRLDVYVVCDGTADPIATGLRPVGVDESKGEAYFSADVDTTRSCAEGQLLYRSTDGYRVGRMLGEVVPGSGVPQAAIYAPAPSSVLLQFQSLSFAGAATSASGAATDDIRWTLAGPTGSAYATPVVIGSGPVLPDLVAPAGGWTPGTWVVTAIADGHVAGATTRVFAIAADGDADGIPDAQDDRSIHPCYPPDAVSSSTNAVADYDNDLLPSIVDPDPCVSAMNAQVSFDPQTLNLVSSGVPITLSMSTSVLDPRKLVASDVAITQLAGLPAGIVADSISVSHRKVEAKFSRQAFIDLFNAHGLSGYVPVVMSASLGAVTARGFDPTAPLYQP